MSVAQLFGGAIGSMLVALGAASIVAWGLRRRTSDRLLLFFGIWCCLYGIRLVSQQPFVRATIGGSPQIWRYLIAFVTYSINVPSALLVEALIGSGWKSSIRRVWQVQAAYGIAAIGIDLALRRPAAAMLPNNGLVLAGLIVWVGNLWLYRHRLSPLFKTPAIVIGASVLVLFVINENLRRPVGPATNIEPIGIFAFVVCLGYGVVGSVFRKEAELLAVNRELEMARGIQTALLPRALPQVQRRSRRLLSANDGRRRRLVRFRGARAGANWHSGRRRVGAWHSRCTRRLDGQSRVFGAVGARR